MLDSREVGEEALLAALMGISEMMQDLSDVDEFLETIVRIAPRLASVNRCAVVLRNPRTREFRVAHAFTPDPAMTALLGRIRIRESDIPKLTEKLLRQRVPVMFREPSGGLLPAAIVQTFKIRSMLLVPLAYQDEVLGFLALDEPDKDHVFTSRDVNVVASIGAHAAVALVHARLRAALHLERQRSSAIAGAASDGIVTLDPKLQIISLSPGAEALLGWRSEEVAGRRCAAVFNGTDGDDTTSVARTILGGKPRGTGTLKFRRKDGPPVSCRVHGAAVASIKGTVAEILYMLRRQGN